MARITKYCRVDGHLYKFQSIKARRDCYAEIAMDYPSGGIESLDTARAHFLRRYVMKYAKHIDEVQTEELTKCNKKYFRDIALLGDYLGYLENTEGKSL